MNAVNTPTPEQFQLGLVRQQEGLEMMYELLSPELRSLEKGIKTTLHRTDGPADCVALEISGLDKVYGSVVSRRSERYPLNMGDIVIPWRCKEGPDIVDYFVSDSAGLAAFRAAIARAGVTSSDVDANVLGSVEFGWHNDLLDTRFSGYRVAYNLWIGFGGIAEVEFCQPASFDDVYKSTYHINGIETHNKASNVKRVARRLIAGGNVAKLVAREGTALVFPSGFQYLEDMSVGSAGSIHRFITRSKPRVSTVQHINFLA